MPPDSLVYIFAALVLLYLYLCLQALNAIATHQYQITRSSEHRDLKPKNPRLEAIKKYGWSLWQALMGRVQNETVEALNPGVKEPHNHEVFEAIDPTAKEAHSHGSPSTIVEHKSSTGSSKKADESIIETPTSGAAGPYTSSFTPTGTAHGSHVEGAAPRAGGSKSRSTGGHDGNNIKTTSSANAGSNSAKLGKVFS